MPSYLAIHFANPATSGRLHAPGASDEARTGRSGPLYKRPAGPARMGYADMVRVAGSLEHIPAERKIETAEWLLARLGKPSENSQGWWAVGRIGARRPFYGSAHNVVPAEVATQWVEAILALDWKKVEPAAFAAAQITRMSGDRSRDLPPEIRATVVQWLEAANAPQSWIAMVREAVDLDAADEGRVFGEALPAGLKLSRNLARSARRTTRSTACPRAQSSNKSLSRRPRAGGDSMTLNASTDPRRRLAS